MEGRGGAQDAAREKDLWVSSRHCRSRSHLKGETFQQRLIKSMMIVEETVLETDLGKPEYDDDFSPSLFFLLVSAMNFVSKPRDIGHVIEKQTVACVQRFLAEISSCRNNRAKSFRADYKQFGFLMSCCAR